jgi:hypothetical protein
MTKIIEILTNKQKIPSWKVDIVQNLALLNIAIPRKTHISGHFHLNTTKNEENYPCNYLIL